jgi:hypothetical protein
LRRLLERTEHEAANPGAIRESEQAPACDDRRHGPRDERKEFVFHDPRPLQGEDLIVRGDSDGVKEADGACRRKGHVSARLRRCEQVMAG